MQIGWSLIDEKNLERQFWGDKRGFIAEIPNIIRLPNGDITHAASPGEILAGRYRLVPRVLIDGDTDTNTIAFDGRQIVVMLAKSVIANQVVA